MKSAHYASQQKYWEWREFLCKFTYKYNFIISHFSFHSWLFLFSILLFGYNISWEICMNKCAEYACIDLNCGAIKKEQREEEGIFFKESKYWKIIFYVQRKKSVLVLLIWFENANKKKKSDIKKIVGSNGAFVEWYNSIIHVLWWL